MWIRRQAHRVGFAAHAQCTNNVANQAKECADAFG